MDLSAIIAFRSSDCVQQILPLSLKLPPQDNATYAKRLGYVIPAFRNFNLTVQDIVEDVKACKICMWLSASANSTAGEYLNEYMWIMEFDKTGEKLISMKEFVDTAMQKEFFPKLQKSLAQEQQS
ncbi:hypothetical protein MMC19_005375 [Ptychographa xylographoides]|nr:hypothetical protein [Ptychographa xylographoides]